jgi:hypothetical protein
MSNIAEGFESRTDVQFINFLGMARASAGEVRSQLYIAAAKSIFQKNSSRKLMQLLKSVPAKSQVLFPIWKLIRVKDDVLLKMTSDYKIDDPTNL